MQNLFKSTHKVLFSRQEGRITKFDIFVAIIAFGLLILLACPNVGKKRQFIKAKYTVADMSTMANCIEDYCAQHRQYPPSQSIKQLAFLMEKQFGWKIPFSDAWGNEIIYQSWQRSDNSVGPDSYGLISPARDGKFERSNAADYQSSRAENYNNDIVLLCGEFIQFPEGIAGGFIKNRCGNRISAYDLGDKPCSVPIVAPQ